MLNVRITLGTGRLMPYKKLSVFLHLLSFSSYCQLVSKQCSGSYNEVRNSALRLLVELRG